MQLDTVIFDMDGLLIDSEPFWQEAGIETLENYKMALTLEQYHLTTGLRTREWIDYWWHHFQMDPATAQEAEDMIMELAMSKIKEKAKPMAGLEHIFSFFKDRNFRIGLATSSPLSMVDMTMEKLGVRPYLDAIASAGHLPFGKPHPQVYMDCARTLEVSPLQCICFEDSFNGLIAAKAARMKCVVIPAPDQYSLLKWGAADLKLNSLLEFTQSRLDSFTGKATGLPHDVPSVDPK